MNKIQTIEDAEWLYEHYVAKAVRQGDCLLLGPSGSYFKIKKRLPSGSQVIVKAHNLALFVKLKTLELPKGKEHDPIEASHLCHNKDCMNKDHLAAETHSLNMARTWCNSERVVCGPEFCSGHGDGIQLCL